MQWRRYDHEDLSTYPTEPGLYRVMVEGDSESLEGHILYEYDDYESWAYAYNQGDEEGELIKFGMGDHDEDPDWFFAYYGPIDISDCPFTT